MDKTRIAVIAGVGVLGLSALGGAAVKAKASSTPVKSTTPPVTAVEKAEAAEPEAASAEEPGDENLPGGGHQDAYVVANTSTISSRASSSHSTISSESSNCVGRASFRPARPTSVCVQVPRGGCLCGRPGGGRRA